MGRTCGYAGAHHDPGVALGAPAVIVSAATPDELLVVQLATPAALMDHDHSGLGQMHDTLGDATQGEGGERRAASGPHDDGVGAEVVRC